ncbi:hypothetical protein [Kitasatospora sp. NPDC087271]
MRRPDGRPAGGDRARLSYPYGEHGCPFPAQEAAEVIATAAIEVLPVRPH